MLCLNPAINQKQDPQNRKETKHTVMSWLFQISYDHMNLQKKCIGCLVKGALRWGGGGGLHRYDRMLYQVGLNVLMFPFREKTMVFVFLDRITKLMHLNLPLTLCYLNRILLFLFFLGYCYTKYVHVSVVKQVPSYSKHCTKVFTNSLIFCFHKFTLRFCRLMM